MKYNTQPRDFQSFSLLEDADALEDLQKCEDEEEVKNQKGKKHKREICRNQRMK